MYVDRRVHTKRQVIIKMNKFSMFITAVCVLFQKQKHFASATNVSQFACARKRHEQQCVGNNVSSFATALNLPFVHNHNSLRNTTVHPKSSIRAYNNNNNNNNIYLNQKKNKIKVIHKI